MDLLCNQFEYEILYKKTFPKVMVSQKLDGSNDESKNSSAEESLPPPGFEGYQQSAFANAAARSGIKV
jgi:hypothetical protein